MVKGLYQVVVSGMNRNILRSKKSRKDFQLPIIYLLENDATDWESCTLIIIAVLLVSIVFDQFLIRFQNCALYVNVARLCNRLDP